MSRVTRQICHDIETPLGVKDSQRYRNTSKYDNKAKRHNVSEKQGAISKVASNDRNGRIKFKSEKTVLNKLCIDTAVNTILQGPFVIDNNCLKLIRSRSGNQCNCKNSQKCPSSKRIGKEVQTFDPKLFSFSDKACLKCVEMTNCGTQFLNYPSKRTENSNTALYSISQRDSRLINKAQRDYLLDIIHNDRLRQANVTQAVVRRLEHRELCLKQADMRQRERLYMPEKNNRTPVVNYMGARRWTLSQYPIRGPDF